MTVRRVIRPAAMLAALVTLAGVAGPVPAATARAADQASGPLPKIWPTPQQPPMNIYENGAGQSAADIAALSTDLAYYVVHGSFPPGVTTPPSAAAPQYACAGTPGA